MFRSSRSSKSTRESVKALPWAGLLQAAVVVGRHWQALSQRDRARLAALLRDSRGRLGSLSAKDRAELRKLTRKLDVKGMGRELVGLRRGSRGRRKCRRGASA